MSTQTLTREQGSASNGNDDFTDPEPPGVFMTDGEGDDYNSIHEGLDKLESHSSTDTATGTSIGDAEELPSGTAWRGYEFLDLSKTNRLLGDVATTGFDRRRPIGDYGMPRFQTRNRIRALGRQTLPRVSP